MSLDPDHCYRAVLARDARFDGTFVTGVTSTGIFCRPSCASRTPQRRNVRFFVEAASAVDDGFRACRRCRPEAAPGSAQWNVRADSVARAIRLINDGIIDREGVAGLAAALGYSTRQVNRDVSAELGVGPLTIARSRRAAAARGLLEQTDLALSDIAFAAGFGSIRSFNATMRQFYDAEPSALRRARVEGHPTRSAIRTPSAATADHGVRPSGEATVPLSLPTRPPFAGRQLVEFLGLRSVRGVERMDSSGAYTRTLMLPHGAGVVTLVAQEASVAGWITLSDLRDLPPAISRLRRLLDLDADPTGVAEALRADAHLARAVANRPGLRSPAGVDPHEMAIRAIVGQQVSVAAAATVLGRLAAAFGTPVPAALQAVHPGVDRLFPSAEAIASADPADLPMPRARSATLIEVCNRLVDGRLRLDAGADRAQALGDLQSVKGIGPWTAQYIAMRALGDPDAWLPTDLGVRRGLERLGAPSDPATATRLAEQWRPWRSYATHYLWENA